MTFYSFGSPGWLCCPVCGGQSAVLSQEGIWVDMRPSPGPVTTQRSGRSGRQADLMERQPHSSVWGGVRLLIHPMEDQARDPRCHVVWSWARPAAQAVGVSTGVRWGAPRVCRCPCRTDLGCWGLFFLETRPPTPVPVGSLFMALGQSLDSESFTVCGNLKSCSEIKFCGVWEVKGVIIKQ